MNKYLFTGCVLILIGWLVSSQVPNIAHCIEGFGLCFLGIRSNSWDRKNPDFYKGWNKVKWLRAYITWFVLFLMGIWFIVMSIKDIVRTLTL